MSVQINETALIVEPDKNSVVYQLSMINQTLCM